MKTNAYIFLAGLFALAQFLAPAALAAEGPDADAIVREMDKHLNFDECRMTIRIDDAKADGKKRSLRANVEYAKDVGTRIEFVEPARDRGKSILMAGSSMWMASPSVSKPVRLSGKDSFMGTSFTNDDVMNLDKGDDYDSAIDSEEPEFWLVTMTARRATLPYSRIDAKIGKDYLPISMTYYARSGKESKRVSFSEAKDFGGKTRPSVMAMVDLMKPGDTSSVIFEKISEEAISRSRMDPATLGR